MLYLSVAYLPGQKSSFIFGSNPHRSFTHFLTYSPCSSGVSNTTFGCTIFCSAGVSHGTTSVTSWRPRRARYAARSSGLTAVPVIHGSDAVVTMATDLPGSLRLPFCPLGPAEE